MSSKKKITSTLDSHLFNKFSFNKDISNNNISKKNKQIYFNNLIKDINFEYNDSYSCSHYNKCDIINSDPDLYNFNPNNYIIEHKIIDVEINSLNDLINMINDNPICSNISYNINMQAISNIKGHLIELNNMIGMTSLKNHLLDQILYFSQGLHKSKNNTGDFMHTVIYGPPGTGKTEVAKILGKIYSKLGILKREIFKKATRADMIAGYLGQTSIKTRELINSCIGGVLFIDEAYSLGNEEKKDSFSKECIDTLCESLSDNKENLMVIIAGYEKELNECFFNYNPGLESRFIWRFKIDGYNGEELMRIFIKKVNDNGWSIDNNSKIDKCWFEKNLKCFKYFGRDVEILFTKSKIAHSRRVFCKPDNVKTKLTIEDLNKGFEMFIVNDRKHNDEKMNSIYL
jgi:SpoVK/Ycf46/Vps4 family AAA+-type ATPase